MESVKFFLLSVDTQWSQENFLPSVFVFREMSSWVSFRNTFNCRELKPFKIIWLQPVNYDVEPSAR